MSLNKVKKISINNKDLTKYSDESLLAEFVALAADKQGKELISVAVDFFGVENMASLSSFGSYSSLLLSYIVEVNGNVPILFLDTGKHFPETLQYVEELQKTLPLNNLIRLKPQDKILAGADASGNLWKTNVNRCCWIRKVEPLDRYIEESNLRALVTGRRFYQTSDRADIKTVELDDKGVIRINPFAFWSKEHIVREFNARELLQHPLFERGYPSIGCEPCTSQVKDGEDERSGRWRHTVTESGEGQKVECGIHLSGNEIQGWSTHGS